MAQNEKAPSSEFEVDSQDLHLQSKMRSIRRVDGARVSVTVLALLMGITILGVSADALNVYNTTHVSGDFLLPLWPDDFDLRPTVALVAGAAVVAMANVVSLLCSRVRLLRSRTAMHSSVTFAAPFVGLIVAVIAMAFFYTINASDTVDTLLSWSCRWAPLNMAEHPKFGTLCKESWAGVYLSILLIPAEAAALALAGWQLKLERHTSAYSQPASPCSPIMN